MKQQNTKEIVLTIVVGLLALYFIFSIQGFLTAALIIGVLGVFSSFAAEKISWVWLKLAEVLGRINSTILLSLIFYIFLTPLALLMKIFQKDDSLKLKNPEASAYDERNHTYTKADLENTW